MVDLTPENIFGPQGLLSRKLRYYEFRPSQVAYANAVRDAIANKHIALLEAQTGTGKTLGYLIPAIESKRRVIISTGTKALQEQLYFKDLPLLKENLGLDFEYVLMKGRRNYLCLLKLERVEREPLLPDEESVDHFQQVREWAAKTESGDIAEADLPDNALLWKELTVSAESCLGRKCRYFDSCYVFKLKQRAENSQIIVVNHHLFFADLSLQSLANTSIFPPYDVVVFDEAHHLAEIATHNLSIEFSQKAFMDLYDDILAELRILAVREKVETASAQDRARKLAESINTLFGKFANFPQKARYDRRTLAKIVESHDATVDRMFAGLVDELIKHVEKTEDLPQILNRVMNTQSSLAFLLTAQDESFVYWAERNDFREWRLQASPLDVSDLLKRTLWPNLHSAVLTSATLFIDQSCAPVRNELGLENVVEESFPYNFDYPSQACLYIAKGLPDPTDPDFAQEAAAEIAQLVQITEGGAFVLCTSFGNMRIYEQALRDLDYPLLIQGKKSKQALLNSFTRNKGSVLLATMSFWQGIDIQGDALVSVIIDKLPFAVPSDPLVEAKINFLKKQGRNAFAEYQLPAAVMLLKQGVGRLIRTSVDYGLLAVLDRRLLTKQYGEVFLRNLPPITRVEKLSAVKFAFEECKQKYLQYH